MSWPQYWVYTYFQYLSQITVTFGLLVFLGVLGVRKYRGLKENLADTMARAISACAIPAGIALLFCSFDTSLLQKMSEVNAFILIAGLSLLYVSTREVFSHFR